MVKPVNIHATCVRLAAAAKPFGAPRNGGILLLGESGCGKSDLALRLVERGAMLVADDRTDLSVVRGKLIASAPKRIAGFIEVRGLGIVELPHTEKVQVALVVDLKTRIPRMPVHIRYRPPKPLTLAESACPPRIAINPYEASAPAKIAAAAAAFAHGLFRDNVKPD